MENKDRLIKAEEVALLCDCSVPTINLWYKWKREHEDDERAQLLPDFEQSAPRQCRYWHLADIPKLVAFKQNIVQGRQGFMGDVTQRYTK